MARVCKGKLPQAENAPDNRFMTAEQNDTQRDEESDDGLFPVNTTNQKGGTPITVCLLINGMGVEMEVDTSASIAIMSENRGGFRVRS